MKKEKFYSYTNYRKLLEDLYKSRKKTNPSFTYRAFSQKAGIKSPNFLQRVIKGADNLASKSILQVAKGFKLTKEETEFFENLVYFNQSSNHEDREYYYYKLLKNRNFIKANKIIKSQLQYFSEWYHVAIRELVTSNNKNNSSQEIRKKIFPKISIKKINDSIKLMENLGLIKKDKKGNWKQSSQHITTGDEVFSMMLAKFHRTMMELAFDSIRKVPVDFYDISAITIPVSQKRFLEIISLIQTFRKKLLNISEDDNDSDEVMQINFQAFPLTEIKQ